MNEEQSANPSELPERPFECGECKKQISVIYSEIIRNNISRTSMCADCPELQKHLQGIPSKEYIDIRSGSTGLECGICGTTLEEIKRGHRLGCADCYSVFEDVLVAEMESNHRLPLRFLHQKKSDPLHLGRSPGETLAINPSSRLLALNEALKETLGREDYEQAALLRDQIKALTEEEPENESSQ